MGLFDLFHKQKKSPFHITNGVLYRYDSFLSDDTEVTVPEGVTDISGLAFESCNRITRVVLPETLRGIGKRAFAGCSALKEIVMPDGIQVIGEEAFVHCTALTEVTLPRQTNCIGDGIFRECTALRRVILPDSLTQISKKAFAGCKKLTEVRLPHRLQGIQTAAFLGCKNLSGLTLPDSLKMLWAQAFAGCYGLETLTLPESLTDAERDTFEEKTLKTLVFRHRFGELTLSGWNAYAGDVLRFLRHPSTSQLEWMHGNCPREMMTEFVLQLYPQYAVFGEYFEKHGGEFGAWLIAAERTDELLAFCDSGFADNRAFDEMIAAAIEHTQRGGAAEMQMLLMRCQHTQFGGSEQQTFFL